ncbi:MAG: hypothetical protein M0P73_16240 [Syntrophobacterales bacterium]|jgi:hypothetical protein|nr:hypothetical protein [Syntrophobacterales bacterium]
MKPAQWYLEQWRETVLDWVPVDSQMWHPVDRARNCLEEFSRMLEEAVKQEALEETSEHQKGIRLSWDLLEVQENHETGRVRVLLRRYSEGWPADPRALQVIRSIPVVLVGDLPALTAWAQRELRTGPGVEIWGPDLEGLREALEHHGRLTGPYIVSRPPWGADSWQCQGCGQRIQDGNSHQCPADHPGEPDSAILSGLKTIHRIMTLDRLSQGDRCRWCGRRDLNPSHALCSACWHDKITGVACPERGPTGQPPVEFWIPMKGPEAP